MTVKSPVVATLLKAMGKIGYLTVAAIALIPLAPVIGLMWFAKWAHVEREEDDFVTVYGKGDRPVRCSRRSLPPFDRRSDVAVNPFSHPAATRRRDEPIRAGGERVTSR